jgi:hypothetical protein
MRKLIFALFLLLLPVSAYADAECHSTTDLIKAYKLSADSHGLQMTDIVVVGKNEKALVRALMAITKTPMDADLATINRVDVLEVGDNFPIKFFVVSHDNCVIGTFRLPSEITKDIMKYVKGQPI